MTTYKFTVEQSSKKYYTRTFNLRPDEAEATIPKIMDGISEQLLTKEIGLKVRLDGFYMIICKRYSKVVRRFCFNQCLPGSRC